MCSSLSRKTWESEAMAKASKHPGAFVPVEDGMIERLLDGERCDHLREPTLAEELAGDVPPEQCPFFAQWILDPESDTGPSQGASYRACDLHRPALEQLAREWAAEQE